MAKRRNNKALILLLAVLVVAVVGVLIYDSQTGERSFRDQLFEFDPEEVTQITIVPSSDQEGVITLERTNETWEVVSGESRYPADTNFPENLFRTLEEATANRVAGVDEDSWSEFAVSDSTGTHVILESPVGTLADFWVGQISFTQAPRQSPYGRNQQPQIQSHIRVDDDPNVYLVDGYLSMMFSGDPATYRNKIILRINQDQVDKLIYEYPGDSSFTLERGLNGWMLDGEPADSVKVSTYLRSVAMITGSQFDNSGTIPEYRYKLRVEGEGFEPIVVEGFRPDSAMAVHLIHSSQNPTALFSTKGASIFNRIFVSASKFE